MSHSRNRNRYKNRKPAATARRNPQPAAAEKKPGITKPQAVAEILSALDGYSNAAAFLGEDSPLIASGTFRRSGLSAQPELLTVTYRESWLAKRIIDMPSEDMTRAWYTLSANLSDEDLQDLKNLEAKHSVKQEMTNAIRWARLYGGSLALMVIRGEEDRLDQPLITDFLFPGCFQGLLVLDRAQGIEPSLELVTDLDDPDFGLPMYYTVNLALSEGWNEGTVHDACGARAGTPAAVRVRNHAIPYSAGTKGLNSTHAALRPAPAPFHDDFPTYQSVRIHHSRVLRFIGRELPHTETVRENYWGASELEHLWDELQKRSATSANIAQLIFQANITTLKMGDLGEHLAYGDEKMRATIMQALTNENRLRTSYGIQLMSAEDSLETHAYTFSGLSEIYEAFMMDMAGAAEIPATKLFGRSPQGMNSTGEMDLRNYYDLIAQMQDRMLRPALEKLLPVMAVSCWGFVPDDLGFVFQPIMTASPAERAELVQKLSTDVIEAFKCGLLTQQQALEELKARGEELGVYTKI